MPTPQLVRVLTTGAVSAGLALGGLALSAPAAQAATAGGTATYTCVNPVLGSLPAPLNTLGSFKVPATFSLSNLPDVLTANVPVPAGVPIVGQFQLPQAGGLSSVLSGLTITLATALEGTPLAPVGVQFAQATTPVVNGLVTLEGTLGSFTPDSSGLPLPIPTSFDASLLTNNPLFSLLGVKCTLDPGSVTPTNPPGGGGGGGAGGGAGGGVVIGPGGVILVAKQTAVIKAKGAKSIKAGQRAVVTVKVTTSAKQAGVGDVTAKLGGTKLTKTLKNGKVRFVLKGLKAGVRKVKLTFAGNSYTEAAKKTFTVRVRR